MPNNAKKCQKMPKMPKMPKTPKMPKMPKKCQKVEFESPKYLQKTTYLTLKNRQSTMF